MSSTVSTQATKDFLNFWLLPKGPAVVAQIGFYICTFFFLSSLRNIAQQYSAYNNCNINQNFYDHISLTMSLAIGFFSLCGLAITLTQLIILFKQRDQM